MTDPQEGQSNSGFAEQPTAPAGHPQPTPPSSLSDSEVQSKKVLVGVMAIVFGAFGVHKFILGYTQPAVIMLGCSVAGLFLGCLFVIPWLVWSAMAVIGLVEGIIYLTKSDADFRATYLVGRKEWF